MARLKLTSSVPMYKREIILQREGSKLVDCPAQLFDLGQIPKNRAGKPAFNVNVYVEFHDFLHARFALDEKFCHK